MIRKNSITNRRVVRWTPNAIRKNRQFHDLEAARAGQQWPSWDALNNQFTMQTLRECDAEG